MGLHTLKPAPGSRKARKRVGRGHGSGTGKTSGRGHKGAEAMLEALKEKGLVARRDIPVKILAKGELTKPLTVHAHKFSAAAREAIEGAGGTCVVVE
ncbi:MAG: 50S ribosomal protein L15 [Actinobacteria bacterium]|nr:MAG: 50S ribosomal protein L15 [Actinomycetota bacterium]